jgi:hypothetical protein
VKTKELFLGSSMVAMPSYHSEKVAFDLTELEDFFFGGTGV